MPLCQQSQVSSDSPPGYLKVMTTPASPLHSHETWIHSFCHVTVFWRLHLEHYVKTTFGKADHFRTFRRVRLRIILWIVLWIAALSHLRHCLRFRVCLSHDQHEHNSERELLVPLFLHGLVIGAASVTALTVFPSANLRSACRFSNCLAVCFIELLIFGPGKGLRIWKGWGCSSSRLGVLISDFGLT